MSAFERTLKRHLVSYCIIVSPLCYMENSMSSGDSVVKIVVVILTCSSRVSSYVITRHSYTFHRDICCWCTNFPIKTVGSFTPIYLEQ